MTAQRTVADGIQLIAANAEGVWVVGAIWVAHADGTVTKVDPITVGATRLARIDGSARAIAVDAARDSIWVDVRSSST